MNKTSMKRVPVVVLAALLLTATWTATARAQGVRPPTQAQVNAAKTMFKRGLVIQVESHPNGRFKQATLFARVKASQKAIFNVLADPDALPRMQPAMKNIRVKARRGSAITYSWTYGDTLTRMEGTYAVALAPPHAIQMQCVGGFGPGTILYRLWPDGPNQTTVTMTINVDVTKSSNAIMRWLSRATPDYPHAWNLGYPIVSIRGLEQVVSPDSTPAPNGKSGVGPLRPFTAAHARRLMPLLKTGSVTVIESDRQGRIAQASRAELVKGSPAAIQKILRSPGRWSDILGEIDIDNVTKTAEGNNFSLSYGFTAFTITSDIVAVERPDGLDLTSPRGDLYRSLYSFSYAPHGQGAILTSTGRARFRHGSRILRRMIDADPYFGHALNASSLAVWSRGFRLRAEGGR